MMLPDVDWVWAPAKKMMAAETGGGKCVGREASNRDSVSNHLWIQ